jgi:hypothetical protein
MANPAPAGSDVSAGTSLPPCPNCGGPNEWEPVSGGDSRDDPYPAR